MTDKTQGNTPNAWIWVRQLADSMIVMAAALVVVGVDLRPYFKAKAEAHANQPVSEYVLELERRLVEVEELAHKSMSKKEGK